MLTRNVRINAASMAAAAAVKNTVRVVAFHTVHLLSNVSIELFEDHMKLACGI
jgi:hypothetical protein